MTTYREYRDAVEAGIKEIGAIGARIKTWTDEDGEHHADYPCAVVDLNGFRLNPHSVLENFKTAEVDWDAELFRPTPEGGVPVKLPWVEHDNPDFPDGVLHV